MYAEDPNEVKHQLLNEKHEGIGLKHYDDCTLLLNTPIIWMIFMYILKNKT